MATYGEKLKDPRWQRRRLEVLERREWRCEDCKKVDKQLQVHHKEYVPKWEPWDYPDTMLVVLCEACHAKAHQVSAPPEFLLLKLPNGKSPRLTADGRIAIYDAIAAVGYSNPRDILKKLTEEYQDLIAVSNRDNYHTFPGKGQQPTPVVDEPLFVRVMSLLPKNEGGEALRDALIGTYMRYRHGDLSLATEIIDRQTDNGQLSIWIEERAKASMSNHDRNRVIEEHGGQGWIYAHCSDNLNMAVTGLRAGQIKETTGVSKTRDAMSELQLALIRVGELAQIEAIKREDAKGNTKIGQATDKSDRTMQRTAHELKADDPRLLYDRTNPALRRLKAANDAQTNTQGGLNAS